MLAGNRVNVGLTRSAITTLLDSQFREQLNSIRMVGQHVWFRPGTGILSTRVGYAQLSNEPAASSAKMTTAVKCICILILIVCGRWSIVKDYMRKSGTPLDQFNSWRYALRPKPNNNNNDSYSSENSSKEGGNYTGNELEFFLFHIELNIIIKHLGIRNPAFNI